MRDMTVIIQSTGSNRIYFKYLICNQIPLQVPQWSNYHKKLFFFYRNYVSSTKSFWFVPSWLLNSSDYDDKIVSLRVRRGDGVAARLGC